MRKFGCAKIILEKNIYVDFRIILGFPKSGS